MKINSFDQGKDAVAALCQHFRTNRSMFLAPNAKEAHIRQMLIDPMFEALGWDVCNRARLAPQYREVVPEDSLDVDGRQRAPDYTFRVGSQPRFYAEAKKCGINLNADPGPAHQLRRYGWSAKVPVSLLTDFEELAVYDCTLRPRPSDRASRGRITYLGWEQYPDRWREIWDLFSREAVWSGAFDEYAASQRKRGTSEVDVEFLKEIEGWREALARNIALRNKDLSSDDLNAAVQRTIDRVVFLRMAEDRGLEPYEQLLSLCDRPNIYARFMSELCRKADEKYNSGIFHFHREAGVAEPPDSISPKLVIDDKVFRDILRSLYFAHGSPYDFGVMPVEILGTVYERFLGKVIRLTPSHQARIEEKPEVRKAGGVYYTPSYIVDYIVAQTVGRHIEGKSPAQLAGGRSRPPLRVLDMACGSGSFLLGAYQRLLDHCTKWYLEHTPENHPRAVYKDARTEAWRLTIEEKKRILTTHLYGVDIDRQAVEVTKLSLLLKALEGEDEATLAQQLELFRERALPNLADNVQCGNSLIGPDYFAGALLPEADEIRRVNPFDWRYAFPAAMQEGGFDCIIGNPPYVRIQTMREWAPLEVDAYKTLYRAAQQGNYDIYVVFIERGLALLKAGGRLGFICPHKFFNAKYGAPIRSVIANGKHLSDVVHFGDQQIFLGATTYTCLLFLDKDPVDRCRFVKVDELNAWRTSGQAAEGDVPHEQVAAPEWNFAIGRGADLFQRLSQMPVKLGDVADIFVGTQTSADDVFVLEGCTVSDQTVTGVSRALGREVAIERSAVVPFLRGREIRRYAALGASSYLICPYAIDQDSCSLVPEREMRSEYPSAWAYLVANRARLQRREKGRFDGPAWYGFAYPKSMHLFRRRKLVAPDYNRVASFALDTGGHFYKTGYGILPRGTSADLLFLLGLLNARLQFWLLLRIGTKLRGGYVRFWTQYLTQLPIRCIDFSDPPERAAHDRMVELVTAMLALHRRLGEANSEVDRAILERQIAVTDAEIDRLVYQLYGLTDEEIAVVESGE